MVKAVETKVLARTKRLRVYDAKYMPPVWAKNKEEDQIIHLRNVWARE